MKWYVNIEGIDAQNQKVEVRVQDVTKPTAVEAIIFVVATHGLTNLTYISVKEVGRVTF